LPKVIVSDQDPKLTNVFWMHFSRKVGKKLRLGWLSISKRLENGACEWNFDQYLRNLVGADQRDWADYVGRAELRYNVAMHLATKGSSLVMACGVRSNLLT
jgi:hypothetical protein